MEARDLALRVARRLADVDGVLAVALGGSQARGVADAISDIDLGLYYRRDRPLSLDGLRRLARELDPTATDASVTELGDWGPWVNGGAWLEIEGQRVDWLYRDLDQVEHEIGECIAGRAACHYWTGFPHGFHTHVYLAEVASNDLLVDPDAVLAGLKSRAQPYPPRLRRQLMQRFLYDADFSLVIAEKPAARGDAVFVAGCLFRCVSCLVQALHALNERWFLNEKRSVEEAAAFPLSPPDFAAIATRACAVSEDALEERIRSLRELVIGVQALCAAPLGELGTG